MCPFLAVVGVLTMVGGGIGLCIWWSFAAYDTWKLREEVNRVRQNLWDVERKCNELEHKVEHLMRRTST